jgi:exportin-1
LQQLLMNMSNFTGAQAFYQAYFMDILQHLFSVVTDTSHTASKSSQVLTS